MIRFISTFALILGLGLSLSACNDDKKAETEAPKKAVEKTQTTAPKPAETATTQTDANKQDMTPAEALDNMKRDAGIVADKAVEGYNATKDAVTKALSD